jgi:hypothetical protein
MEENGSEGIFDLIKTESTGPGKFLSDVDYFCISVRMRTPWTRRRNNNIIIIL